MQAGWPLFTCSTPLLWIGKACLVFSQPPWPPVRPLTPNFLEWLDRRTSFWDLRWSEGILLWQTLSHSATVQIQTHRVFIDWIERLGKKTKSEWILLSLEICLQFLSFLTHPHVVVKRSVISKDFFDGEEVRKSLPLMKWGFKVGIG